MGKLFVLFALGPGAVRSLDGMQMPSAILDVLYSCIPLPTEGGKNCHCVKKLKEVRIIKEGSKNGTMRDLHCSSVYFEGLFIQWVSLPNGHGSSKHFPSFLLRESQKGYFIYLLYL